MRAYLDWRDRTGVSPRCHQTSDGRSVESQDQASLELAESMVFCLESEHFDGSAELRERLSNVAARYASHCGRSGSAERVEVHEPCAPEVPPPCADHAGSPTDIFFGGTFPSPFEAQLGVGPIPRRWAARGTFRSPAFVRIRSAGSLLAMEDHPALGCTWAEARARCRAR
ncbi:MAG: hypothetical protein AAF938_00640 [Myxococcota bacterium]